jgi:hypothetical protein
MPRQSKPLVPRELDLTAWQKAIRDAAIRLLVAADIPIDPDNIDDLLYEITLMKERANRQSHPNTGA